MTKSASRQRQDRQSTVGLAVIALCIAVVAGGLWAAAKYDQANIVSECSGSTAHCDAFLAKYQG